MDLITVAGAASAVSGAAAVAVTAWPVIDVGGQPGGGGVNVAR